MGGEDIKDKQRRLAYGYIYGPEKGDPMRGIPPGTPFKDLPDDWVCLKRRVGKDMFEKLEATYWM